MIPVEFLSEAAEEFAASALYYESQQRGLGELFVNEVENTLERIATHPKAASRISGDIRRRLVHRLPFAVLYRVEEERVIVSAVAHRRRKPGYWVGRT